jgi:integrase
MTVFYNEARKRWQYDFQRAGKRHAGYCTDDKGRPVTSKRAAEDAEARIKAAIGKPEKPKPATSPNGFTLAQAFLAWAEARATTRRTWPEIKARIKELRTFFGDALIVEHMTEADIDRYVIWARTQPVKVNGGGPKGGVTKTVTSGRLRSDSRINRYLDTLRTALNFAKKRRFVRTIPDIERLEEPKAEPNPISPEAIAALLAKAPDHLRDVVELATNTGMRMQEVLRLESHQVNLRSGVVILGIETKGKRGRVVHLNHRAQEILARLELTRPPEQKRLILYRHKGKGKPKPISSVRTAWESALEDAGILGKYRFHDTRAAFCSWLAERGVDPVHIKELAGHQDIKTTMRYTKAADSKLKMAVALLD